jgi:predicted HTH transcriptional regulator
MSISMVASITASDAWPTEKELVEAFGSTDGRFILEEGSTWDFKREWPFSYSNDYFGGIARLICAFWNSEGGWIVFGVHDAKRTGGHNKVTVNVDKLTKALSQLLNVA